MQGNRDLRAPKSPNWNQKGSTFRLLGVRLAAKRCHAQGNPEHAGDLADVCSGSKATEMDCPLHVRLIWES
jgi:hypothetical protein